MVSLMIKVVKYDLPDGPNLFKYWMKKFQIRNLKVSKFQNELMKSSFLPKYEPKIVRISLQYLVHVFVRNDDFINSFWNLLTFNRRKHAVFICYLSADIFALWTYIFYHFAQVESGRKSMCIFLPKRLMKMQNLSAKDTSYKFTYKQNLMPHN